MTKPRYQQVSLMTTPYYHCVSRCVRKAFLCGNNYDDSISYEHRRGWIEERLLVLSSIFMIDIVSYAIMSNHYHVILAVNYNECQVLTDKEVVKRWHSLFKGTLLTQDFSQGCEIAPSQQLNLHKTINTWRERLTSISWFMRCINENIARRANEEDNCTGRFWEGRFKSQALLDEQALIACMAYVDLNPIRANIAKSLDDSEYTSIKRRLDVDASKKVIVAQHNLMPFKDDKSIEDHKFIPIDFDDYVNLLACSGMQFTPGSEGGSVDKVSCLLSKIGIKNAHWVELLSSFEYKLKTIVGGAGSLLSVYRAFSIKRIPGKFYCLKYFKK